MNQKKLILLIVLIAIALFGILNYFNSESKDDFEIGKLKIPINDGLYFKIYQENNSWEHNTALYFEVIENEKLIVPKTFFSGVVGKPTLGDFTSNNYDNIGYLTFLNKNDIVALYNHSTKMGYSNLDNNPDKDSLLKKLVIYNENLKFKY